MARSMYYVFEVVTRGGNMAARVLLVLTVLLVLYGCGQSSPAPEQGAKEQGAKEQGAKTADV